MCIRDSLLIEQAVIDPVASSSGSVTYLTGYDGQLDSAGLFLLITRLLFALYLDFKIPTLRFLSGQLQVVPHSSC